MLAVTDQAELIRFNAGQPERITARLPLLGLPAGEKLVGIDFRVARGVLYAMSSRGQLYTLNPESALVELLGLPLRRLPLHREQLVLALARLPRLRLRRLRGLLGDEELVGGGEVPFPAFDALLPRHLPLLRACLHRAGGLNGLSAGLVATFADDLPGTVVVLIPGRRTLGLVDQL